MSHQNLRKALIKTYNEFAVNSSIHGLKYTAAKKSGIFERIVWLIIIGIGCLASGMMFNIYWTRFSTYPTRTVFESVLTPTINEVPIPTITICTKVKIMKSKLDKIISELNLHNHSEEDVKLGISQLVERQLSKVNVSALTILDEVLHLNGKTDISSLISSVSPSCDEIMLRCRYEGKEVRCSDIFAEMFFEHKRCCVSFTYFVDRNGLFKSDPERYTSYSNNEMGFSMIIESNINDSYLKLLGEGITIMVHSQQDRSYNLNRANMLHLGTVTDVEIDATVYKSTERMKNLHPSIRQCYFKDEYKLSFYKYYTWANCAVDVKLEEIIRTCGCSTFFTNLKDTGVEKCTNASKLPCILKIESEPLPPECFSDCETTIYEMTTSFVDISPNSSYFMNPFLNGMNFTPKTIILNVFYGSQFQKLMTRDTVTSADSLGGIFSLFLGLNVISFVEIFYYLFVRLPINFRKLTKVSNSTNRLICPFDFKNTVQKTISRTVKVRYTLDAFKNN